MGRFEGKTVLVTGAARGQGRAHALAFAAEGADIVAIDICEQIESVPYALASEDDLRRTAKEAESLGRRVLASKGDVRSGDDLSRLVERAISEFGKIDVVVANAGIWALTPFWQLTDEQWSDMLDVNLTGVWRTLKAVVPSMIERCSGAIVITASINGLEPGDGFAHYVASKHGVIGLMKNVALELGKYRIRCNAVCPGIVDTAMNDWQGSYDMIAGGPGGTPDDRRTGAHSWSILAGTGLLAPQAIAQAVLWLASDDASEVTGACLPVDGGHMILPGVNPDPVGAPS